MLETDYRHLLQTFEHFAITCYAYCIVMAVGRLMVVLVDCDAEDDVTVQPKPYHPMNNCLVFT